MNKSVNKAQKYGRYSLIVKYLLDSIIRIS